MLGHFVVESVVFVFLFTGIFLLIAHTALALVPCVHDLIDCVHDLIDKFISPNK
jgi:hypothetical protein